MMHPLSLLAAGILALTMFDAPESAEPVAAEVPEWIAELQRPPSPDLPEASNEVPTLEAFETRRQKIVREWREFMGTIEVPPGPPAMRLLEEVKLEGGITRRHIELEVEPGIWTTAYLHLPPGEGPFPAIVTFHPTSVGSIRVDAGLIPDRSTRAFGLNFARLGFVTISPRNYLWRADEEAFQRSMADEFLARKPEALGMMKMVHDGSRALDYLLTLPMVDGRRIGAIGHSLGAKQVIYFMAFDSRVSCGVSSEGGIEIDFSNYDAPWYLGPVIREEGFPLRGRDLLWLIAPRAFLLFGGDVGDDDPRSVDGYQSWPAIAEALPVYRALGAFDRIGLYVHDQGHAFTEEAREISTRWMLHHLRTPAAE